MCRPPAPPLNPRARHTRTSHAHVTHCLHPFTYFHSVQFEESQALASSNRVRQETDGSTAECDLLAFTWKHLLWLKMRRHCVWGSGWSRAAAASSASLYFPLKINYLVFDPYASCHSGQQPARFSPPDGHQHLLGSPPASSPTPACHCHLSRLRAANCCTRRTAGPGLGAECCGAGRALALRRVGQPNCPHRGTHLGQTADCHQPCVSCLLGCGGFTPFPSKDQVQGGTAPNGEASQGRGRPVALMCPMNVCKHFAALCLPVPDNQSLPPDTLERRAPSCHGPHPCVNVQILPVQPIS